MYFISDDIFVADIAYSNGAYRSGTSMIFFGGLLDIFVSYVVWFVLVEEETTPLLLVD